jgi:hypothetical protein
MLILHAYIADFRTFVYFSAAVSESRADLGRQVSLSLVPDNITYIFPLSIP